MCSYFFVLYELDLFYINCEVFLSCGVYWDSCFILLENVSVLKIKIKLKFILFLFVVFLNY